jgi:hypothetical protein
VAAPLKEQLGKWRRELEDSWNPLGNNISQWFSWPIPILMPMFLPLLFLSFLPCNVKTIQRFLLDCMSAIANQKFNQCTSREINLSKTVQRTAVRAPTRTQEPEDPAPYNAPCQQEVAKRPMRCPNSQSSALTVIIIKEKME